VENNNTQFLYSDEQLMARLKFFIGICLAVTLTGIVFVVLYSLIFVTQPLNAISPIDQKFFELIIPIATFLTGTLSGIMLAGNNPDAQKQALEAANKGWDRPPLPITPSPSTSSGGFGNGASTSGFGASTGGFGASTGGFGSSAGIGTSAFGATTTPDATSFAPPTAAVSGQVTAGFNGLAAPVPAPQPPI
jgi:uncharacterized membrane protein YgcG